MRSGMAHLVQQRLELNIGFGFNISDVALLSVLRFLTVISHLRTLALHN